MNLPRYEFCKENRKVLLEFLKISKEQSQNMFCNHQEYQVLKKLYPVQSDLKKQLEEYIANESIVIDITGSSGDEDEKDMDNEISKDSTWHIASSVDNINHTATEDITYAVKENLDTQKCLLPATINNLQCSSNLEDIFTSLSEEFNFEEVINFGKSLQDGLPANDSVVILYVKYLLINKAHIEFSEDISIILNNFAQQHSDVISELSEYILDSKNSISKAFLQLLERLNNNLQIQLLKSIVLNCSGLQESYIGLIDTLLNNEVDFETLSKLVELLSTSADRYKTDKSFGKMILNVIKFSGKNITLLGQSLEYITAHHKSIWKSKIQKIYEESLEEASLMSQSFR